MKPTKFALLRHRGGRPVEVTAPEVKVRLDLTELLAEGGTQRAHAALRIAGADLDLTELLAEGGTQRAHAALRIAGADLDRGIITTYPDPSDPAKVIVVWKAQDADDPE
jgi:hypothetical protein